LSYLDDFEHDFMRRTLKIVQDYEGDYDATILVNCLLGLLVVPKERFLKAIPEDPLSELSKWGINPKSIIEVGRPTKDKKKNPHPDTLRGVVYNLRNSVAHFRLEPIPRTGEVHSFDFATDSGFHAVIKLDDMRNFINKLAGHLDRH